jgi:hypothetical protein
MSMILRFGLLMESVSSCIILSQVSSCLTNSSSVFLSFSFYLQVLRFCLLFVLFY